MFCTSCGNQCREGAKFCPKCGARLLLPADAHGEENLQEKRQDAEGQISPQGTLEAKDSVHPENDDPGSEYNSAAESGSGKRKKKKGLIALLIVAILAAAAVVAALFFFDGGGTEKQYEKHMEAGRTYLEEEAYDEAVAEFGEAIAIDENVVEPYQLMAQAYIGLEDNEKADKTYDTVRELIVTTYEDSDGEELLEDAKEVYLEAVAYYDNQGNTEKSAEVLCEIAEILPEDEDIQDALSGRAVQDGMDGTSQSENLSATIDTEEILREQLEQLVAEYGVSTEKQMGTMTYDTYQDDGWFDPTGIMGAVISDMDGDNAPELFVCIAEPCEHEDGYYSWDYHIVLCMWEVSGTEAVQSDSMILGSYNENGNENGNNLFEAGLESSNSSEGMLAVCLVEAEEAQYIVCEFNSVYATFGDGSDEEFWALEYANEQFQYVCSLTQGGYGSDGMQFIGYDFENGEKISSQLYYDWEDSSALYNDFGEALDALFGSHGIQTRWGESPYSSSTELFLSEDNEMTTVFQLVNERTSFDSQSYTASFCATVTREGDLLE